MLYAVDRSAVILKPTRYFLDWLNNMLLREKSGIELTLEQICVNCRVLLVPQFNQPEEVIAYIDERYLELFEMEIISWYEDKEYWPANIDLQTFWEFFQVEILDEVIDLVDENLNNNLFLD